MQKYIFAILILSLTCRIYFYFTENHVLPEGTIRIRSTVKKEPLVFEKAQRIEVEKYLVYLPLYPSVSYGDYVIVSGVAEDGTIQKGKLEKLEESKNVLYQFRERLLVFYKKTLPSDAAALVSGVTIGSKGLLTSEFWKTLTATGTAHVVVASGMNVTLVSKYLLDLLLYIFPRRSAIPLAAIGIWLYAVLAGFDAPIVRATLMATLTFTAQGLGKVSYAYRTLFLTSVVMLLAKPEWITDLSFLLSFFATLAIMILSKPIENKLKIVPMFIRSDFSTSIAASVGVAPILFYALGNFNLFSPFINALVLWTIAPITIIGALGGILGLLFEPIGALFLYLIYPLCLWFLSVVQFFS